MVETILIDEKTKLQKCINKQDELYDIIENLKFDIAMLKNEYEKLNTKINRMKNDYR